MHATTNVERHHHPRRPRLVLVVTPPRAAELILAAGDQLKDLLAAHRHEWSAYERSDTERLIAELASAGVP